MDSNLLWWIVGLLIVAPMLISKNRVTYFLFLFALVLIIVLSPIVLFFQVLRKVFFFKEESVGKYIHTVAISLDQLGAALIYGEEDWCVSSLAYYDYKYENKNKLFMHFINFLFNDKEHCKVSFETEYAELKRLPK